MINFLRNRPPNWRDYIDSKKSTAENLIFIEGTPPEMIKQFEEECEARKQGLKI